MSRETVDIRYRSDSAQARREAEQLDHAIGKIGTTAKRESAEASAAFSKLERNVGRSVVGIAAGFGAFEVGRRLVTGAISAASDLNEEVDKAKVVFGENSREVLRWSTTTNTALGLSQRESLGAAGAFGTMLTTVGVAGAEVGRMSKRMVQLASDTASFNNEDPSDMLERLRSGLAGEAEPLRRFGILLSEARVQQEALALGIAKKDEKLDESQKVLARYSLILKDSAIQHGNFALTSGSLANQQRILAAEWEDSMAELGQQLLPLAIDVVHFLSDEAIPALEDAGKAAAEALGPAAADMKEFALEVAGFRDEAADAVSAIDDVVQALGGWDEALTGILAFTVVSKVARLTGAFTTLAGSATAAGAATGAATGVGGAAAAAARLRSNLLALPVAISVGIQLKVLMDPDTPGWLKTAIIGRVSPLGAAIYVGKELLDGGGKMSSGAPTSQRAGALSTVPASANPRVGKEHDTANLAGFPALDVFVKPGTPVLAPEDGALTRITGSPPSGKDDGGAGVDGYSLYFVGDSGTIYFMTHLAQVAPEGPYVKGEVIGVVADHARGSHVHVGIHDPRNQPASAYPDKYAYAPSTQKPTMKRDTYNPDAGKRGRPTGDPEPTPAKYEPDEKEKESGLILGGGLDAEQQRNARTIWDLAKDAGLSDEEALEMIAAAYAESGLRNKTKGPGIGLFQLTSAGYQRRYRELLAQGYGMAEANTLAILPDYEKAFRDPRNRNAPAGRVAALVERPSKQAIARAGFSSVEEFYRQGLGSTFRIGKGGYTGSKHDFDAPDEPDAADAGSLAESRGNVSFILGNLDRLLPAVRARIRKLAAELRGELAEAVTQEDADRVGKRVDRLLEEFTRLAELREARKQLGDNLTRLKAKVETLPDDVGDPLEEALGRLRDAWKKVDTQREFDRFVKQLSNFSARVGREWEEWQQEAVDGFDRAWAKLRGKILRAFDEGVAGRIRVTAQVGGDELSRAEAGMQTIRGLEEIAGLGPLAADEQRAMDAVTRARNAQAAYQEAVLAGDQALAKQRAMELAAALSDLTKIEKEEGSERVQTILRAGQDILAGERAQGESRLQEEQRRLDELTEGQREQLEEFIDEQMQLVRDGELSWGKAWESMKAKAREFGLDLDQLGGTLGADFGTTMVAAVNGVRDAVLELARALGYAADEGKRVKGELAGVGVGVGVGQWPESRGGTIDPGSQAGYQSNAQMGGPVSVSATYQITVPVTVTGIYKETDDLAAAIAGPVAAVLIRDGRLNHAGPLGG